MDTPDDSCDTNSSSSNSSSSNDSSSLSLASTPDQNIADMSYDWERDANLPMPTMDSSLVQPDPDREINEQNISSDGDNSEEQVSNMSRLLARAVSNTIQRQNIFSLRNANIHSTEDSPILVFGISRRVDTSNDSTRGIARHANGEMDAHNEHVQQRTDVRNGNVEPWRTDTFGIENILQFVYGVRSFESTLMQAIQNTMHDVRPFKKFGKPEEVIENNPPENLKGSDSEFNVDGLLYNSECFACLHNISDIRYKACGHVVYCICCERNAIEKMETHVCPLCRRPSDTSFYIRPMEKSSDINSANQSESPSIQKKRTQKKPRAPKKEKTNTRATKNVSSISKDVIENGKSKSISKTVPKKRTRETDIHKTNVKKRK